jgi:hypothetical protein
MKQLKISGHVSGLSEFMCLHEACGSADLNIHLSVFLSEL